MPVAHTPKTIHGIEMKFGGVVENHKLPYFPDYNPHYR